MVHLYVRKGLQTATARISFVKAEHSADKQDSADGGPADNERSDAREPVGSNLSGGRNPLLQKRRLGHKRGFAASGLKTDRKEIPGLFREKIIDFVFETA